LHGNEPAQQLLEARGRVLRRAPPGGREVRELHPSTVALPCRLAAMPSALVTGGSSGIGLAIARMLREDGYDLTLASRTPVKVEAAAAELDAVAAAADVSREDDCVRLVAQHAERFGGLDVLVNSAGLGIAGTVEALQTKHLDLQLGVNLRGMLLVTRE